MNSEPSRVAERDAAGHQQYRQRATTGRRSDKARSQQRRVGTLARGHEAVFLLREPGPLTKSATAAGTKVSDSTIAAVSAMTTVNAIGWNIFPSTPVRAKIGR